ncbi:16S rRNA (adenine(1518)-N(6)/adenine(1519)-N(6))-dimethyltransferase RsmA [Caldivirga maquilingensis]|uniref:Ribosomal RNA adenine methylase transferase n=1 Tax=Caldivirga maquilingensis (strain ATCC 700844 / DSM 13496 / JCM 10307 / IC-167) TaxID=397948 RepID=A8M8U1_CALMQ|nr:16S rRNA (adenine(1518)-N(6)/adenine(1519)-N(6))-dimethyltransferase RsmA [Caldivirga maquilingensis]ABW02160.1 ribosomal RNA adenine methylase transferase [Caldivirga maquilingensis IC-167]
MVSLNDFYAVDKWTLIKLAKSALGLGIRVGGDVHFMVDPVYLNTIAQLAKDEKVLEVGFGLSYLTHYLAKYAQHVFACDVNPMMIKAIKAIGLSEVNADLFICDALTYKPPIELTVVSNIPYSITSRLLLRLLTDYGARKLILTLQREVALRLAAKPGSTDYGRLSVITQCLSLVKVIKHVPPWAFWPRPKVYSAIVELKPLPKPCVDVRALESLTSKLFTQPNKKAIKVIKQFYGLREGEAPSYLLNKRVRELSVNEVAELVNVLINMGKIT